LLDTMFDRRSAWRATSIWTDAGGERMESVQVLDSGLRLTTHEL
jgi:hypothetical protein